MEQENIAQFMHDHFSESDKREVLRIIQNTNNAYKKMTDVEFDVERLTVILDQYQEQPHLLDPHLEEMVGKLMDIVQDKTLPVAPIHLAYKYLYLLSKVRGPKCISRLFGHEVADLEPVLQMLMKQDPLDHETWETRYILLLWLSMVSMIPFDMVKLDGIQTGDSQPRTKPTMDRILDTAKQYLDVTDASRDAAGLLIGKFMSRHDVKDQRLSDFIDWLLVALSKGNGKTMRGMMSMIGILSTLASIFKHGRRESLLRYAPIVLERIVACDILNLDNTLLRKLGIKVIQRLGLTFLKPRIATWRYKRGDRSLTHNMNGVKPNTNIEEKENQNKEAQDQDEEYDVPDEIEEVIENLLTGLKDKDTIVRWSAAKGIGRITGQLPKELADEVVGSLLEFFTLRESDSAWHGGCLALAELGRRGLLLPQRLPEVVPVVLKALIYDERRGSCSVGANVRDAACYVCWSFARAYDPKELTDYVHQIASALIIVTIFDREVNCRRAAAAAFQENVGRQGTFPHGIDILTTADYFAVGNRSNSYLNLSVYIAQFKEYTRQLIDHLVDVKLTHWDCAIRELASKALHNLTSSDEQYMIESVLPRLMASSDSLDLFTKHGSIVAVAEVTHALYKLHNANLSTLVSEEIILKLNDLVPNLTEGKQFRGHGGDFMRRAERAISTTKAQSLGVILAGNFQQLFCTFIEKLSLSNFPVKDDSIIVSWQAIIDDTLPHTEQSIREETREAVTPLAITYYQNEDGSAKPIAKERIISKYLQKLSSTLHFDGMGFALGIGAFPRSFLRGNFKEILDGLMEASKISTDKNPGVFSEVRRDALLAISRVCLTAGIEVDGSETNCVCSQNIERIFDHYFLAMNDYTTDSRGDVGAWVREAAMTGLEELTIQIVREQPTCLAEPTCSRVIGSLLQQAFEKIDRTREHAGNVFFKLLYFRINSSAGHFLVALLSALIDDLKGSPEIPHIPCREKLMEIFPRDKMETMNWKAPSEVFPTLKHLLRLRPYVYHVLLGLIVSAGGLAESLVRYAADSLLMYVQRLDKWGEDYDIFSSTIIQIFEDHTKNDRVILPLFKVLDLLLGHGCFDRYSEAESDPFSVKIFELMHDEVLNCPSAKKLLASINVFCGLIQFPGIARTRSLSRLMLFLCHKFPRVRKEAAEQLYLAFIGDFYSFDEDTVDQAIVILSETQWDANINTVRESRNKVCDLFGIKRPKAKVTANKGTGNEDKVDQLESYRDLVSRHDY